MEDGTHEHGALAEEGGEEQDGQGRADSAGGERKIDGLEFLRLTHTGGVAKSARHQYEANCFQS
jgi:hypothetical protein